jgi:hypothetical protein
VVREEEIVMMKKEMVGMEKESNNVIMRKKIVAVEKEIVMM